MSRRMRLLGAVMSLMLFAAACGDDDSNSGVTELGSGSSGSGSGSGSGGRLSIGERFVLGQWVKLGQLIGTRRGGSHW